MKISDEQLEAMCKAFYEEHSSTRDTWVDCECKESYRADMRAALAVIPDPQPGPMPSDGRLADAIRVHVSCEPSDALAAARHVKQLLSPAPGDVSRWTELLAAVAAYKNSEFASGDRLNKAVDAFVAAGLAGPLAPPAELCAGKLPAEVWGLVADWRTQAAACFEGPEQEVRRAQDQMRVYRALADRLESALQSAPRAEPVPGAAVRSTVERLLCAFGSWSDGAQAADNETRRQCGKEIAGIYAGCRDALEQDGLAASGDASEVERLRHDVEAYRNTSVVLEQQRDAKQERITSLEDQIAALARELDRARTDESYWRDRCYEARTQRDEAFLQAERARVSAQAAIDDARKAAQARDEALAKVAAWKDAAGCETPQDLEGEMTKLAYEADFTREQHDETLAKLAARPEPAVIDEALANPCATLLPVIATIDGSLGATPKNRAHILRDAIRSLFGTHASVSVPQDEPATWYERWCKVSGERDQLRAELANRADPIYVAQLQEAASVLSRIEQQWVIEGDYADDGPDDKRHPIERRLAGMQAMHARDVERLRAELEKTRAELENCQARLKGTLALADERSNDKARMEHELLKARAELESAQRKVAWGHSYYRPLAEQHEALRSGVQDTIDAMEDAKSAKSLPGNEQYDEGFNMACGFAGQLRALLKPATPVDNLRSRCVRMVRMLRSCMANGNQGHYGYAADAIERYVLGDECWPPEPATLGPTLIDSKGSINEVQAKPEPRQSQDDADCIAYDKAVDSLVAREAVQHPPHEAAMVEPPDSLKPLWDAVHVLCKAVLSSQDDHSLNTVTGDERWAVATLMDAIDARSKT
jgi:hypothetical protein